VLLVALLLLRKSVRASAPAVARGVAAEGARDVWDDRLDEELERRRSLIS
jgi:hypothetical protein